MRQLERVTDRLREFLVRGRAHRLLIALHETDLLERENPRLLVLLRQFPMSIEIHRTIAQARNSASTAVVWALLYDSAGQQFWFYPYNGSSATEISNARGAVSHRCSSHCRLCGPRRGGAGSACRSGCRSGRCSS